MKKYVNTSKIRGIIQKRIIKAVHCMGLISIAMLSSCEQFVEVPLPDSQLSAVAVFENTTIANAAVANIYATIRDGGMLSGTSEGLSSQLGHYTDELIFYGNSTDNTMNYYNNALLPSLSSISATWNKSYSQIYATNTIIEGLEKSTTISNLNKEQLTGEALFIRALIHSYLAGIYGEIPYVATTNHLQNSKVHRMSVSQVYDKCIEDLEQAITMLPNEYVSADRSRANKSVALALLSRLNLNIGNWTYAIEFATDLIEDTQHYAIEENPANVFLKESTSTIWHLVTSSSQRNTDEALTVIFDAGPPPFTALNSKLIESFESGDLRKVHWTKEVTDGITTWYHSYKYKAKGDAGTAVEYPVVFRLEEQYLIRAEAYTRQGELEKALQDLNWIRNRAGLPNSTATSAPEVLTAILKELRIEFFTEYGHRFFDLKRYGLLDSILSVKTGWNTSDNLFPIPEAELSLNPNLAPQNTGY